MNPINSYNPHYGNSHQQLATIPPNQPTTSFTMQPTPTNMQQQYEVCQVQPTVLQLTYNTQFPPLNYQLPTPQPAYYPHIPPLTPQETRMQIAVTPHIAHAEDPELEENSDKETQAPIHEWQVVNNTKKRKIEHNQKKDNTTKQTLITTSNRFEALSKQTSNSNDGQTQPTSQPIHKPTPIFIYGVLN